MDGFNTDRLYSLYKQTRNRIRKHTTESLVLRSIDILHKIGSGNAQLMQHYQPWNILLLLKWTFEEADYLSSARTEANLHDFHRALNSIHDMYEHVRMPDEYEHVNLFMRHLAFQQFWLQHPADGASIARQELLFSHLDKEHRFQKTFKALTGISCSDFSELSFGVILLFLDNPKRKTILRQNFSAFPEQFIQNVVDPFLSTLSRDTQGVITMFSPLSRKHVSVFDQILLPTPLIDIPFLKTGESHTPYSPVLLYRSLEKYIYRRLKRHSAEEFSTRFGLIFQDYVEKCLLDSGVTYYSEQTINKFLLGTGKCVDFVVTEQDCNIFIEAKAVEASDLGRLSHQAEIVFRSVKESAGKAVKQGMATAKRVHENQSGGNPLLKLESYLIVVTFDALHLGSNTGFKTMFGEKFIRDLETEYNFSLPVPLGNIFFLTIEEFEYLSALLLTKKITIAEVLRHAQRNDADHRTHKFSFIQHLESLPFKASRLPILEKALAELQNRCIARLTKKGS